MKGGIRNGWLTVYRCAVPPHGVPGFDERDARRVSAAGLTFRGGFPSAYGRMAPRWETPDRPSVELLPELPPADARRSAVLLTHLPQDLCPPGGAGTPVRHEAEQSPSVDSRPLARAAGGAACPRR